MIPWPWSRLAAALIVASLILGHCREDAGEHDSVLGAAALISLRRCIGEVTYRVAFQGGWSAGTHGGGTLGFPSAAHFSAPVGTTHNGRASFWSSGGIASSGMEAMAEDGSTQTLRDEFHASLHSDCVFYADSGVSPGTGQTSLDFRISASRPLVTLVLMVAPSPDWFLGVSSLNLLEGGAFVSSKTVSLFAYDAGTDSGATFTVADSDTNPKEPIALIGDTPLTGNAMGTFTFTRQ